MSLLSIQTRRGLSWLINELDARPSPLDAPTIRRLLSSATFTADEIAPYIEERPVSYARHCVVRRDNYELLVLTWLPSQGSVAHDHSGCLCGLKVFQGQLTEQLFDQGPDGQVRKTTASQLGVGQITVDPGVVIHSLTNDPAATQALVTVHIYSPPLPEVRRYAVTDAPPAKLFLRSPPPNARVIAVIGGGFTGAMTLANLLRFANQSESPLHIVLIDRQPAIGEGVAYRSNDPRHLLNVPASRMSAWPDRPDDFINFVRATNSAANPGDFLPRKIYGQYVRRILLDLAAAASDHLSVQVLHDEATRLLPSHCLSHSSANSNGHAGANSPTSSTSWTIETAGGRTIQADLCILTVGHRPPNDPFGKRWIGPRNRFVADPWAALVLSQIGPDEPVLLLGSGLTAVDAILTLDRPGRVAPLTVISRHGLMPLPHARSPQLPADLSNLLSQWLDPATPLKIRHLLRDLRRQITADQKSGTDWRQIIDALRPAITRLWGRLDSLQRSCFLRHLRPFWEIHRHRMAPDVADTIDRLRQKKILQVAAGAVISAVADQQGVDVTLSGRGSSPRRTLRVSWVINCTGPGAHNRHQTHPLLRPLLEAGTICNDEFDLGLHTDSLGRAVDSTGQSLPTLLVAGTLRKSTLWESTAVPELRQQAQTAAQTAIQTLSPARVPTEN